MDPPDPHRTTPLPPRERAALARIEAELLEADPRIARGPTPPPRAGRFPHTAAHVGALTGLLALLVVVATVLPPAWRGALGPLAAASTAVRPAWCVRTPRRSPAAPPPTGGTA